MKYFKTKPGTAVSEKKGGGGGGGGQMHLSLLHPILHHF